MIILEQKVIPATDVETFEEEGYTVIKNKKNGKYYAYPKGYVDKKSDEIQIESDEVEAYEDQKYIVRKSEIDGKYYAKKKKDDVTKEGDPKKVTTDAPSNQQEGDKFRAWVNNTYPDYAKKIKLDPDGSYNNSYIKKAWAKYKDEYNKFISGGGKVVTGKTGGFPINTLELSNMFRDWVSDNHSGYITNNTDFKKSITDVKEIADEPLKKAWFNYGDDYIDFLRGRSNSILSNIGIQLAKDYDGWKKTQDAQSSGLELQRREKEFEKKKCTPWYESNLIKKQFPTKSDDDLNIFTQGFIDWADKEGYIDFHLPSKFCGEDKTNLQWVNQEQKDDKGKTYQPYQHSIVRFLSLLPMWVDDEARGQPVKSNLLNKYLRLNTKQGPIKLSTDTDEVKKLENIPTSDSRLAAAAKNVELTINRQSCKSLRSEVDRVKYDNTDRFVNNQIGRCKIFHGNTFKESIETKLKGKLKLMKENKSLSESITNKIKSKKTEKTLSYLSEEFNKQNYRKFFDSLNKLKNNSINEATNLEFEKSFDVIFKGKENEFKNRAIEYILNKLEVLPTSELGMNIKSELDKVPSKEMFTNEYDISDSVTSAIEKSNQSTSSEEKGLKSIVSKSIKFDIKQIKQEVRKHLHDYVEGVKDDVKSLEQKLKSSIMKRI